MSENHASPNPGYEARDASVRTVLVSAGMLVGGLLASITAAAWIYRAVYANASSAGLQQTSFTEAPSRRLGISEDRAAVEKESREHLETYGWADRKAGVVRVPIEQAMDNLVAAAKSKPAAQP